MEKNKVQSTNLGIPDLSDNLSDKLSDNLSDNLSDKSQIQMSGKEFVICVLYFPNTNAKVQSTNNKF